MLKTSSNGFTSVNPHSTRTVRVANNEVIPVSGEGTFQFTAVCDEGKLHAFSAKHAVYAPGLRNLISSGIFEDQGHEVSLKGDKSCIRLEFKDKPSIRIPLRCEGRLRYLDYLVPDIPENHVSDHALSAHAYEAEIPDTGAPVGR